MKDIWNARFKKYAEIGIVLAVEPPRRSKKDQATVKFDQTVSLDGRPRTYEIEAKLLQRRRGWQIIDYDRKLKKRQR